LFKNFYVKSFVVLVAVGIVFYLTFNMVMSFLVHSKKEVIVPNIEGKDVLGALEQVSKDGLSLRKVGEKFDQEVPPGVIVSQSPNAGMVIRQDRVVKVSISRGGKVIYVPELVGQTISSAESILKNASLILGEVQYVYSAKYEKGFIVSQDPASGSIAEKDALVIVSISNGPPLNETATALFLPEFVGKNIVAAQSWAEENEVTLVVEGDVDSDVAESVVVWQNPDADSDIANTKKLILKVAAASKQ
jgi:serine/threonine-protein kinase